MPLQRYVSTELTHFAGRGRSKEEQYDILLAILRSRMLKSRGLHEGPVGPGGGLVIDPTAPLDEMFTTQVVCFCDIPLGDLALHAEKYSPSASRSGKTSCSKRARIQSSMWPIRSLDDRCQAQSRLFFGDEGSRRALFEAGFRRLLETFVKPEPESVIATAGLRSFIAWYIGCFIKPFDPKKAEDDPDNYYMEREWRVLGKVDFQLDDIVRVFLPKTYFARFREDLPEYVGQIQEV